MDEGLSLQTKTQLASRSEEELCQAEAFGERVDELRKAMLKLKDIASGIF